MYFIQIYLVYLTFIFWYKTPQASCFNHHCVQNKGIVYSLTHSLTHSLTNPPTGSPIYPPTDSSIHPPTHSLTHPPFTHPLTHSSTYPPNHSLTHSIIHLPTYLLTFFLPYQVFLTKPGKNRTLGYERSFVTQRRYSSMQKNILSVMIRKTGLR